MMPVQCVSFSALTLLVGWTGRTSCTANALGVSSRTRNITVETELVYIELAIVHYKSNKTKAKLQHKT